MSGVGPAGRPLPVGHQHRVPVLALSGLITGSFVSALASTAVTPALPGMVTELGGDQTAYTWIVTAGLLAMTVSTTLWGKLSDLLDRKRLVQLSLVIFTIGCTAAGFGNDTPWVIACRAVQGIGQGGLMALVPIVIADLIPARDRGKYMGIVVAIMGAGQLGAPVLGGVITDSFGWRWAFWAFAPFAVLSLALIQRTLRLAPRPARKAEIDYLGAVLIAGGVTTLLIWVSHVGNAFAWSSWETVVMVVGAVAALVVAVVVELRVPEPIVPIRMVRDRTFALATLASVAVGAALFSSAIFLTEYMQLARGATPTHAGLMIVPMIAGQMVGGVVAGHAVSRTGTWKPYVVGGAMVLAGGMALLSTIRSDTSLAALSFFMVLVGVGLGSIAPNLMVAVQNSVGARDLGAATAGVTFARSLGGALGVSVLGAYLASRVSTLVAERATDLAASAPDELSTAQLAEARERIASGGFDDLAELSGPLGSAVDVAFGIAVSELFLIATPIAILAVVAIAMLPNKRLSPETGAERLVRETAVLADPVGDAIGSRGSESEGEGARPRRSRESRRPQR